MIQVKENLCVANKIVIIPADGAYNSRKINIPDGLIDGEIYTFSAKVNQSDNGSGRCGFVIRRNDFPTSVWTTLPIENFVYKFKYDKERQAEILIYSDVQDKTHNIGAEFYNISIVKGDGVDIYTPNINNLPKEKRGFLPPEGHYKEIQAL